ncbi:MAG: hypothetical protein J6W77_03995 [Prevotella sp.]|nr:hypothetical protein [Prevotella sp.]
MNIKSKMAAISLLLMSVMFLSSCQTKQSAVNQLEKFSYELRDNCEYYNLEDWKKAAYDFQKIRKNLNKHDYTPAERKQIGELEGKCAGYFASGVKKKVTNGLLGIGSEIKGMIEGILNSIAE